MVVPEVREDDVRLRIAVDAGLRPVAVGPTGVAPGLAAVEVDDEDAYARVARYLVSLGHERIAAVADPLDRMRTAACERGLRAALSDGTVTLEIVPTDGSVEGAAAATRRLLTQGLRPTAIVLATDVMALAALDVARRTGLVVPWDVSVVAGADSVLCRLATPALTSLPSLAGDLGEALARAVTGTLDAADDTPPVRVPLTIGALAVRGSTAPQAH
ncbi:MAG: substrate-binding domain-containing protein [Cellulomonas sp.]|nr:substrate-binding domain-containing protein [Cellulomonas sp.]MCR6647438.1 substrate-binding domain-containing protein [Cellulomonas sp.]